MAGVGPVAAKLRGFVRARVRPDGKHYVRGNAARLAEHLEVSSAWITGYTDQPPTNHADLDTVVEMCRFYGISLADLTIGKVRELPRAAPADPLVQAATEGVTAALEQRVERHLIAALINTLRELARLPAVEPGAGRKRARQA